GDLLGHLSRDERGPGAARDLALVAGLEGQAQLLSRLSEKVEAVGGGGDDESRRGPAFVRKSAQQLDQPGRLPSDEAPVSGGVRRQGDDQVGSGSRPLLGELSAE